MRRGWRVGFDREPSLGLRSRSAAVCFFGATYFFFSRLAEPERGRAGRQAPARARQRLGGGGRQGALPASRGGGARVGRAAGATAWAHGFGTSRMRAAHPPAAGRRSSSPAASTGSSTPDRPQRVSRAKREESTSKTSRKLERNRMEHRTPCLHHSAGFPGFTAFTPFSFTLQRRVLYGFG